jgi:hypothetical protein
MQIQSGNIFFEGLILSGIALLIGLGIRYYSPKKPSPSTLLSATQR